MVYIVQAMSNGKLFHLEATTELKKVSITSEEGQFTVTPYEDRYSIAMVANDAPLLFDFRNYGEAAIAISGQKTYSVMVRKVNEFPSFDNSVDDI